MYAYVIFFYIIGNFILGNLIIFFCLDAIYQGGQVFVFLLINISNISIKKQISNRNIILTSFKYFLDLLQLLSIDAKSAKGANVEDNCIENISVNTKDACNKKIYIKVTYIESTCIKNISIKDIYIKSACIRDTYLRNTDIRVVCIKNTCFSNIYT